MGDDVFGVSVVGSDGYLDGADPAGLVLVNGLGANPDVRHRQALFGRMKSRGFAFAEVRHPSAIVGRECVFGEGAQLMAGAVLQNRVRAEENVVINTRASIDHVGGDEEHGDAVGSRPRVGLPFEDVERRLDGWGGPPAEGGSRQLR